MISSIVHLPSEPLLPYSPILLVVAWPPNLQAASFFYPPLLLLDDSIYELHSGVQKLNLSLNYLRLIARPEKILQFLQLRQYNIMTIIPF